MAKSNYTLIVPSICEQSVSGGLQMAGERQFRGRLYRVEWYRSGLRVLRDGVDCRYDDLPPAIVQIVHDVKRINDDTARMRRDAAYPCDISDCLDPTPHRHGVGGIEIV